MSTSNYFNSSVESDTKIWLKNAANLTMLPVCLRSHLMNVSNKLSSIDMGSGFSRLDVCQNCGLKYDKFSAKFIIQSKHIKTQRRKRFL